MPSPESFRKIALRAGLAQRLVRTLAEDKKGTAYDPTSPDTYAGRIVLPELVKVSGELRDAILTQSTQEEIEKIARKGGYVPMKEWGNILVEKNITTKEEVERVTS